MVRLMITGPQLGPVSITFTIIISLTDRRWRPACLVTAYNSHNYNNKTHRLLSLPTHKLQSNLSAPQPQEATVYLEFYNVML